MCVCVCVCVRERESETLSRVTSMGAAVNCEYPRGLTTINMMIITLVTTIMIHEGILFLNCI